MTTYVSFEVLLAIVPVGQLENTSLNMLLMNIWYSFSATLILHCFSFVHLIHLREAACI
jgi:hypothetical protein